MEQWIETKTPGYRIVKAECGQIIGMVRPNERIWFVGDRVFVIGDHMGYICPEIMKGGPAKITQIREDDTEERYIGVEMENSGEIGFIEPIRIL